MHPNYTPQPGQPYGPPVQQYPGYPMAPQGYPAPMPQYPAQPAYGAPQGYPMPQGGAPVPPPAVGSLDGFYGQPSTGGGPALKFKAPDGSPQIGKTYVGVVSRPLTDADVRQATNQQGMPQTYRDGRPKWIMVVPLNVQASPEFPEGVAGWWVKGQARDELVRAMAAAGAPAGPPEHGATIQVTLVSTRAVPNMNPQFLYSIVYTRPGEGVAAPVAAPVAAAPAQQWQAPAVTTTAPAGYPVPQIQYPAPVQYAPAPQYAGQTLQPAPAPAPQAMIAAPAGYTNPPMAMAVDPALAQLTPQQQGLVAQLIGGQAPAQQ